MKPSLARTHTTAHAASAENDQPLTPFRWLLLLGFPPDVAAHIMAPEVFSDASV